jgi:methionyl-tRNA formyltransferase
LNSPKAPIRALVFAYHNVGVGCIKALLDAGIQIELVVTHADDPHENIWFGSVAALCQERGIPYVQPEASGLLELLPRFQKIAPDYIFSFYYRYMIASEILATAGIAALNMHGSLLPKYRGRAPVNWAILHGETETGASLHIMEAKPDAGDIVGQVAVPIDPDEDATAVFAKVSNAAIEVMRAALPELLQGRVPRTPNVLANGSYFGGRKPEDGRIQWSQDALQVHNLIRAVAPPYPGAFTDWQGSQMVIAKSKLNPLLPSSIDLGRLGIQVVDNRVFGICGNRQAIEIMAWQPASANAN